MSGMEHLEEPIYLRDRDENDDSPRGIARRETLTIPQDIRNAVDQRDNLHCRVCGRFVGDQRALHHIIYGGDDRGIGGRRVHNVDEIITVCWMWGRNCHELVHSDKKRWQPLLLATARRAGITAMQLERWVRHGRPHA